MFNLNEKFDVISFKQELFNVGHSVEIKRGLLSLINLNENEKNKNQSFDEWSIILVGSDTLDFFECYESLCKITAEVILSVLM